jgi:membrane protein
MSRGRGAESPQGIPTKGWLDIAKRIWARQGQENLGLVAAGIAFYGLLSLFPGLTALVAVAGVLLDPDVLIENSQMLAALLPESAAEIITGQLDDVLGANAASLGIAAVFTLGLALFSASKAVANFIIGLNIVYDEDETRGFVALTALKLALTAALIVVFVLAIAIVAALPAVAAWFGGSFVASIVDLARWPLLLLIGIAAVAVLFRFAPNRRAAEWRWLTPGAALACILWVAGSIGFSFYVQSFGTYNETFGALGGVIVLLTWLWLSAFVVLLGALLDAELEAQTAKDSTVGKDRPMGERDAVKADRLGAARDGQEATAS